MGFLEILGKEERGAEVGGLVKETHFRNPLLVLPAV